MDSGNQANSVFSHGGRDRLKFGAGQGPLKETPEEEVCVEGPPGARRPLPEMGSENSQGGEGSAGMMREPLGLLYGLKGASCHLSRSGWARASDWRLTSVEKIWNGLEMFKLKRKGGRLHCQQPRGRWSPSVSRCVMKRAAREASEGGSSERVLRSPLRWLQGALLLRVPLPEGKGPLRAVLPVARQHSLPSAQVPAADRDGQKPP